MNRLRSTVCLFVAAFTGSLAQAATAVDIARLVAPVGLISACTCATYAEAAFATPLALRLQQPPARAPYTAAAMKDLLTRFDAIATEFCTAVGTAMAAHPNDVAERFASAYAAAPDADLTQLLGDARAVQWFADNQRFLAEGLPLTALYAIVHTLAPELLGPALRVPSTLLFAQVDDPKTKAQLDRITTGDTEFVERRMIQLMLADPAFARIAPPRFRLNVLAQAEAETRARGAAVLGTGRNQGVSLHSFDSTFVRTRSHFGGFDVARAYGLGPAFERARAQMNLLTR